MLKKIKQKLCDPKTGKLKTNVIVALGLAGILLIFLSGLDFGKNEKPSVQKTENTSDDADDYRAEQEKSRAQAR